MSLTWVREAVSGEWKFYGGYILLVTSDQGYRLGRRISFSRGDRCRPCSRSTTVIFVLYHANTEFCSHLSSVVPANCTLVVFSQAGYASSLMFEIRFELCDLDQWYLPYPSEHFDVIHARFMHTGVSHGNIVPLDCFALNYESQIENYSRFLHEIARMLRPGGLVILIEPDTEPIADGKTASHFSRFGQASGMRGWFTLWETYRRCLRDKGIDVGVPPELSNLVASTGAFDRIISQEGNMPIGFWPKGIKLSPRYESLSELIIST